MDYFKEKQYIAEVDSDNNIIGKVEKWKAHKKGILHRAFTVAISYEDHVLLQHRKHPVFDSVFDSTISSHQLYMGDTLQTDEQAVMSTLTREWNIKQSDLVDGLHKKGNIYYKATDSKTEYIEHEICHIYTCTIKKLPLPNLEFAYGFTLQNIESIKNKSNPLFPLLAPWVVAAIQENLL